MRCPSLHVRTRAIVALATILAIVALAFAPTASAANVTVSGTAIETLQTTGAGNQWTGCNGVTANVQLVLDSGAHTQNVPCNGTDGTFSFTNVPLSATHVITVYLDAGSGTEQGVTYTRNADTTSNITGLLVSDDRIRLRTESAAAGPLTTAHINAWDNGNDPSLPTISDGTVLSTTNTQRLAIVVDSGSTFNPSGDVTVNKLFLRGTWNAGATTLVLTGTGDQTCPTGTTNSVSSHDTICRSGGTFNAGTGIVRFTLQYGGNHTDVNGPFTFNTVQIQPAGANNDICIANSGNVTMATGDFGNGVATDVGIWGSGNLFVTGNLTLNSGVTMNGDGDVEVNGDFTSNGTGEVDSSSLWIIMRPAGGTATIGSTSGSGDWYFDDLYTETSAGAATVQWAGGGTGTISMDDIYVGDSADAATTTLDLDTADRDVTVREDVYVSNRGRLDLSNARTLPVAEDVTVDGLLDTNGGGLDIIGSLDVNAGGTVDAFASAITTSYANVNTGGTYTVIGAGTLTINRDLRLNGTFTAGTGTVEFVDAARPSWITASASATLHNVINQTPNKQLRLYQSWTLTLTGTLTVQGASCDARASIGSTQDGNDAKIAAATVNVNFADLGDINQTSGLRTATNSWDSGGNTDWAFTTPCTGHTVTGTALQSPGGAAWSQCDGITRNVGVTVNGFAVTTTSCAAGSGAWSVTTAVEPDQFLLAFLNPVAAGDEGATATLAPSPAASFGGLTVVEGQFRIRSETATAVTNEHLVRYDEDWDLDIPSDVSWSWGDATFDADIEVVVEAGDTYAAGDDVDIPGALEVAGTIGSVSGMHFAVGGVGTDPDCDAPLGTSVPVCIRPGGSIAMDPLDGFVYYGDGTVHVAAATYPHLDLESSGTNTYQFGTSATDNVVTMDDSLYVDASTTVSTSSFDPDVTITNDLDIEGRLEGDGTGTILVRDDIDMDGEIDLTAGTFLMELYSPSTQGFCGDVPTIAVWDLTFANIHTSSRTSTSEGPCAIQVRNDLQVGRATDPATTVVNLDAGDSQLDVDGDVIITSRGDLRASNASTMTVAGDWIKDGSFTANGGTTRFDAAGTTSRIFGTGSTTFANLQALVQPKTLQFKAGATTTVSGTMTITGTSCLAPVTLESTTAASPYTLNIGTVAFSYATLRDSIASPARSAALTGDLGNNSGWTFTGGCTPAPNGLFVDDSDASSGATNPTSIGTDTFHMSWNNASGQAIDEHQARVVTTPLSNVVALWQFDTGPGATTDSSGNGRTLTMTGGPTTPASQTGMSQAIGLDGTTQYATAATSTAFDLGNNFTVEAWFRRSGVSGSDQTIVERGANLNRTFSLYIGAGMSSVSAITSRGGSDYWIGATGVNVVDGAWHHVALTVDSSNNQRIYVDGTQVGGSVAIGGPVTGGSGQPVRIGRYGVSSAGFFGGEIDDVRISSVARTPAEILGYARLRDAHAKTIWTSSAIPTACANAARCADITYAGPALRRPGARYYAQTRGRLQAWAVYTAWSTADWFETSAQLSVAIPGGNVDLGAVAAGSDALATSTIEIDSDVTAGYQLSVADLSDSAGMTGAGTLPDWTGTPATPTMWASATPGYFGVTVLSATGGKDTARWGTASVLTDFSNLKFAGARLTTPTQLFNTAGPSAGTDSVVVGLRASPGVGQAAGAYSTTLTFTVVANP